MVFIKFMYMVHWLMVLFAPFWAFIFVYKINPERTAYLSYKYWLRSWMYAFAFIYNLPKRTRKNILSILFSRNVTPISSLGERKDWQTPGSCESCESKNCCKLPFFDTYVPCPNFDTTTHKCYIYNGLWWHIGPCGAYPKTSDDITFYNCKRFCVDCESKKQHSTKVASDVKAHLPDLH